MTFFSEKNSRETVLMLCFVLDQVFRILPFFSQIFRIFATLYMLNVVYDPFLTRKTQFFTLFIRSRASDNTTSKNIGGTDAWAVPNLKFWGGDNTYPIGFE